MSSLSNFGPRRPCNFQAIVTAFLAAPGLPFAGVLSAERIERLFAKQGNLFGVGLIYSTATVVWAFLGQVLRDGKGASCQAAVADIANFQEAHGAPAPTADTGDYCKARGKLSEAALRDLTREIAAEVEQQAEQHIEQPVEQPIVHPVEQQIEQDINQDLEQQIEPPVEQSWLWLGLHAMLVDGFTFTMPDTAANQAEYPAPTSQKKGVGLPIARAVAILSLATACVMDLAVGPYAGKKTGETALLRKLLKSFQVGDVAVMDRYYCSFMMIALLLGRGVQVCARMHQRRDVDFRRGRRLGKCDHIIVWTKPQRPTWMDQATYDAIPATLELRELRFQVVEPGFRSTSITIATTLTDAEVFTKEEIARLYGFRWNSELDIRSIKQSLNLKHVRCKSPEMVRKELWTTFLGYNLIRTTAAAAARLHGKQPRQISFTSTCQYVLSSWMELSSKAIPADQLEQKCRRILSQIARCEVANRPGRLEPRVLKRRRHGYPLMQEPRAILRAKLLGEPNIND